MDLTDLAKMATSNKELGRVDPKTPLERAKSDDLSGMVLVLDESTNEIPHDHHKSPGKHKRRRLKLNLIFVYEQSEVKLGTGNAGIVMFAHLQPAALDIEVNDRFTRGNDRPDD